MDAVLFLGAWEDDVNIQHWFNVLTIRRTLKWENVVARTSWTIIVFLPWPSTQAMFAFWEANITSEVNSFLLGDMKEAQLKLLVDVRRVRYVLYLTLVCLNFMVLSRHLWSSKMSWQHHLLMKTYEMSTSHSWNSARYVADCDGIQYFFQKTFSYVWNNNLCL